MSNAIVPANQHDPKLLENLVLGGDWSKLSPENKVVMYKSLCDSQGLNPLTQPFAPIMLNGKLTLYATKNLAEQLRQRDGISIQIVSQQEVADCYVVHVRATTKDGRCDEDIASVPVLNLKGEAKSNALMKAITKAKRRVTLSICSLGCFLDETEVESVKAAKKVQDKDIEKLFYKGEVDQELPNVIDAEVVEKPSKPKVIAKG